MRAIHLPLRLWIPVSLGLLALLLTAVTFIHDSFHTRLHMQNQMRARVLALGARVAPTLETFLGRNDEEFVATEIARLAVVPDLNRVLVLNEADRVLHATEIAMRGRNLQDTPSSSAAALMRQARAARSAQIEFTSDGKTLRVAFPFPLGSLPGEIRATRVGIFYTETDLIGPLREERSGMLQRALLKGGVTLLAGAAIWLRLWLPFSRRLNQLVRGVAAQATNLDLTQLPAEGSDELARIGQAVRRMTSELTERESAVRKNEEQLNQLIVTSPGVICSFRQRPDGSACFPYASPRIQDLYGFPPEELAKDAAVALAQIDPDDTERVRRSLAESARTLAPWREEFRIRHATRGQIWIAGHYMPQREADGSTLWHGIILDVTEAKQVEAIKETTLEKLKALIGSLQMGVLVESPDRKVLHTNQVFCRLFGLAAPEAIIGADCATAQGTAGLFEDSAQFLERIRKVLEDGKMVMNEVLLLTDGRVLWRDFVPVYLRDKLIGNMWLYRDVTERHRAEQELRRLNRTYSVLSGINQIIVREKDSYTMLENACRIVVEMGRLRMAWIGIQAAPGQPMKIVAHAGADENTVKILHSMFENEQQNDTCAFTSHAFKTGQHGVCNDIAGDPQAAPWREQALQRGYRSLASLPLKSGETVIGTFNLYAGEPNFFDEDEMRLLDELATDISFALEVARQEAERRKSEDELRWRTAFFEAQVNSALDGILVVDRQGKMILQNGRFNHIWKIPMHIIESKDTEAQLQFATSRTKNPTQFLERSRHLDSHPDEVGRDEIELLDGTILDRYSSPVRDKAGKHYGRIWNFRNITERRRLEEQFRQSQKMEAIGQLAGGVAHDFNNILAAIMMQADIAATGADLPTETREMLDDIRAAAERAASLTRQLLAFSRRQVLQTRPLDLNEIVTSLTKMLQRILGEDVHLQLNLHPRPLRTRADAGMLDQVLLNLVINARDAMPSGGRLVIETTEKNFTEKEAAAIQDGSPGRHVCLSVTDTGCGIAPENRARIFEPFFTTKAPGKGTGLGLATVFGIIKQHGGSLTVASEVGKGTTFQIFLPATEGASETPAAAGVKPKPQGGTETILLVEDEPAVRILTRTVLERAGYNVLEAAHGRAALNVWEENQSKIQLLFTDIVMPEGISGRELAERLRKQRPELRVIFASGYSADVAGRELALQDGQNFIQKPASSQQILETVRRCLDS